MKTFTRFAIAAIVMLSVAFMSTNHVWAANPAQTTGGPGDTKIIDYLWFANFPNGTLPQGGTGWINDVPLPIPPDVPTWPDTGHTLHMLALIDLGTSTPNVGPHLVCFRTPASGGAIFWWEPTLQSWVPLANFQIYPNFDGVAYTCVNTWLVGRFMFGYVVP